MRESVCFFDMDGVLADFVGGSLAVHGKSLPPMEVGWDFMAQVGFAGAGDPAFWGPLSNPEFWSSLPVLGDGVELFRAAESAFGPGRVAILSSGLCPGACDGKRAWLRRHLPGHERRAVFCAAKEICAAPCKLLVDDHGPNAEAFAAHGGRSLLVPRPWNARRGECRADGDFDAGRLFAELVRL